MNHATSCRWETTHPSECEYRATHHYCPHPEHACDCPPARAPLPTETAPAPDWDRLIALHGLTFNALRCANVRRLPLFKNRRGEPAHSQPDGSDWSLGDWSNAVLGELGEAANLIKKIQRGDMTLDEARPELADELADVQTYLDILAFRAGIDLGVATISKWNRVSKRVGVDLRLTPATGVPNV